MGVHSFAKLCAVLGFISLIHVSTGFKTIDEVCQQNLNSPQDSKNCDIRQFLICSTARVCTCSGNMVWQKELDKCTYPLNAVCSDQFGGPNWPGLPGGGDGHQGGNGPSPGCPHNAYCDTKGSKQCRCNEGTEPDTEYRECNGGTTLENLTSMTLTLLLSYFVAIKLLL